MRMLVRLLCMYMLINASFKQIRFCFCPCLVLTASMPL